MAGQKALGFGFGDLEETAVLARLWKMNLVIGALPVNPVCRLHCFKAGMRWTVVIVVDDEFVTSLDDAGAFGPALVDRGGV